MQEWRNCTNLELCRDEYQLTGPAKLQRRGGTTFETQITGGSRKDNKRSRRLSGGHQWRGDAAPDLASVMSSQLTSLKRSETRSSSPCSLPSTLRSSPATSWMSDSLEGDRKENISSSDRDCDSLDGEFCSDDDKERNSVCGDKAVLNESEEDVRDPIVEAVSAVVRRGDNGCAEEAGLLDGGVGGCM